MIIEEIKMIKMEKSDFRKFGIFIGVILGLVGGYLIWRNNDYYFYCLIFSLSFISTGLLFPSLLKPIYRIWMSFAILMGWVTTRVILIFLYYLICTPTAIFARIARKNMLELDFSKNPKSYWKPKNLKEHNFDKQF